MSTQLFQSGGIQTAAILPQVIYLDFDGELTSYNGGILTVDNVTVEDSGLTAERIAQITSALNEKFAGQNVLFVSDKSDLSDQSGYSTIYVGKTSAFAAYGSFAGLAETVDSGNKIRNDNAFVMLDSLSSNDRITDVIAHEAGHLLGTLDHGGEGLNRYASSYIVSSGVTSTGLVLQCDSMCISSGGTANSTTINSWGSLGVSNGGTANSTTINSWGSLHVSCGGTANSTTVNSYGFMYVESGGIANSTAINDGGWMYVYSGGTANSTTVNFRGCLCVFCGGTANSTTVKSDGGLYVSSGGTTNSTTVNDGGGMCVESGSIANSTAINDGGWMYVSNGGTANSTTVSGGGMCVYSGGTACSTIINSGYMYALGGTVKGVTQAGSTGHFIVSSGGTASDIIIEKDAHLFFGGSCSNVAIHEDGLFECQWGGYIQHVDNYGGLRLWIAKVTAEDVTIHSGAYCAVGSNSVVSKTIVESGGTLYLNYCSDAVQGTAIDTYVMAGGYAYATSFDTSRFKGYLKIAGTVKVCSGDVISEADSLDFIPGKAGDTPYLSVSSGSIASGVTITADISSACGKYTLISGGVNNIQNITVTNDGVSKQLSVGSTISVAAGKTAQLTRENSKLYLTVNMVDTTPPATPGNIQSELAENQLTITWNEVTDLTGVTYNIEYSKDSTFTDSVLTADVTDNEAELMLGNGTWYWRMRSTDGAGNHSAWSTVSTVQVNHTDVLDGTFSKSCTYYGDVVVKATAEGNCSYPACVRIMAPDCVVTVEGGSLSCNTVRNAAILFGEDAYWVNEHGYGDHYDGTVTFTGKTASLSSKVSSCITAAGIAGKNLTVNFAKDADGSAGITFHAGQGTGSGDYAAAVLADGDLVINGTFGGTAVSLFDFSLISDERWAYAEGFGAGSSLTVNGGISGTILASAYAPTQTANGYGLKAEYNKALTVTGTISGTVAAFGKDAAYALYGGWIKASVSGVLFAGSAKAGKTEADLLALLRNTKENRTELVELASGFNAVYDFRYGESEITISSGAEIFGGIAIRGTVSVSSGAFISGTVSASTMTISLDTVSASCVLGQGWKNTAVTINADNAQNGVYSIAENLEKGTNISVVYGDETKTWNWQNGSTIQFTGGKKLTFQYADEKLSITAAGFSSAAEDVTAPDISGVAVTVTPDENQALVSWTPAEDESGVTQYRVRYAAVGNSQNAVTMTVSAEQLLLSDLQDGSYTIQIQAGDAAGNWSEWTVQQQFTISSEESADVLLSGKMPQAEYMHGCVPTSLGMLLGYYDLYGYNGNDYSDLIPGTITVNSRGTDGNIYDMDAYDTVLGNFITTEKHVSRFVGTASADELPYTYKDSDPEKGLNISCFDCLSDWIGTSQYWRSNGDLSTTHYNTDLDWLYTTEQTQKIGSMSISARYLDFKWGLDQYLQTVGYSLDREKTKTAKVDTDGGDFTFEDYMAEIDAGRPVLIGITGHQMVGYGYNAVTREIIFDDTYVADQRMVWGETYYYSDQNRSLQNITTIVFNEPEVFITELSAASTGISWKSEEELFNVQYSTDSFATVLALNVESTGIETYALPSGTYQWQVKASEENSWHTGNDIAVQNSSGSPQCLQASADGIADLFFSKGSGTWEDTYEAQHLGTSGGWSGTGELAELAGKNKITDVFVGSADANILVLTDDVSGDALFVDDVYSAFPAEQQARIAKINEIRAGAGDDIVDMTSRRFAYSGDGLVIRGGDGSDTIWANAGDNMLFGDAGNDRIVGASDDDVIIGGSGNDSMHGGGGNDIFCFCKGWGADTVEQLTGGTVTLWFVSGNKSNWDQTSMTYSDGTNSVKVTGVSQVTLKFGDDSSALYDTLLAQGCFMTESSEKIWEEAGKGIVASL